MKRVVHLAAPGLIAVMALCSSPAQAWNTKGTENWRSIYVTTGSHHDHTGLTDNEHGEIADHHLHTISTEIGGIFGSRAYVRCDDINRCAHVPIVIDLNASHIRRDLEGVPNLHLLRAHGDFAQTELEERTMPPVAMFSGLADFNYTIYDWINKGTRCPSLPLGADKYDACHEYATGWLGSGFNTTHWGDLAVKVYGRHHQIALGRAAKAKAMDALFRNNAGGLPDGSRWHARYTAEMELLALYYEAAGQHFLQDRWATGHMFSRWGSPDYENLPQKNLAAATVAATLTGVVHGSREIFGHPDPLNLPEIDYDIGDDDITPAQWRRASNANLYNGVGDFAFKDLLDGRFGADYDASDEKIHVERQNERMTMCGTEGFRHIISNFAQNGGKFGAFEVTLPQPGSGAPPGSTRLGSDPTMNTLCTDAWVTNESFRTGLRTIAGSSEFFGSGIIHEVVAVVTQLAKGGETPEFSKLRFGQVYTTAWFKALKNEDINEEGVQSAKPGFEITSWGLRPNHNYAIPSYFEPANLEGLPWLNEQPGPNANTAPAGGMDRAAIQGFFNRAHTEYWCDGIYDRLADLRALIQQGGPRTNEYRAVCTYLAQRAYKAVDPAYPEGGDRFEEIGVYSPFDFERQPAGEKYGDTFEPVCAYYDAMGQPKVITADATDDTKPYYIKPGYVGDVGAAGDLEYGPKTLENWCDSIPVVDFLNDEDYPKSVGQLDHLDGDRTFELTGASFGIRTGSGVVGTVEIRDANGDWIAAEIWDGMIGEWGGGWSLSDIDVFFRLPGAPRGYPSLANGSMSPDEIKATEPAAYPLRLTRPADPDAPVIFRADGEQTIGDYELLIAPHWAEEPAPLPSNGTGYVQNFPSPTPWFSENMERFKVGFYVVSGRTYTEVPFTLTVFEDEQVLFENGEEVHTSLPGNVAAVLRPAAGQTFGPGYGNAVFFIAFH